MHNVIYKVPKSWLPLQLEIVEDGKPANILHTQIIDLPAASTEKPKDEVKSPEGKDATT
jgi:hypothetical protein